MRVDANVSIRPVGTEPLGTKVEIKNMNSLRSLGRAIDYEIERQIETVDAGERIVQETRHWDEAAGRHARDAQQGRRRTTTATSRSPTSCPVAPSDEMRAAARAAVPELPAARRARFVDEWGIAEHDARGARRQPGARRLRRGGGRGRRAGQGRRQLVHRRDPRVPERDRARRPRCCRSPPDGLAELIGARARTARCRAALAKDVLDECLQEPKRPKQVVEERGLAQVSDEGELGARDRRGARRERGRGRGVPGRRRQGARRRSGASCSAR